MVEIKNSEFFEKSILNDGSKGLSERNKDKNGLTKNYADG